MSEELLQMSIVIGLIWMGGTFACLFSIALSLKKIVAIYFHRSVSKDSSYWNAVNKYVDRWAK